MRMTRIAALGVSAVIAFATVVLAQDDQNELDDAERATQIREEFEAAPYTDWAFEPNVPQGYYVGVEPHGMILRTFLNDVAIQDTQGDASAFSEGAILVKENHMPGDTDVSELELQAPVEEFEGNLAALTYMVKMPGYNPDAGDWFWAKTQTDGTIDAAGTPDGCIACHTQVADQDYVFNVAPGGN